MKENFYIAFDISPEIVDETSLLKELEKARALWGKKRNHPTQATRAQMMLKNLSLLKTQIPNPEFVKQASEEAKLKLIVQERKLFEELDDSISILSKRGYIKEEEIERLKKQFKNIPIEKIKSRIKVEIRTSVKSDKSKKIPEFEKPRAKDIKEQLKVLNKENLYDFLEVVPNSSLKTINERVQTKNQEVKRNANKTAQVTATQKLVGQCLNIFKTELSRSSYDEYLRNEKFDSLKKRIVDQARIRDYVIDSDLFEELQKDAMRYGYSTEVAKDFIVSYAKTKKISCVIPQEDKIITLKKCGFCGVLNEPDANACVECGTKLILTCPKCKQENPSANRSCSKCGFAIGDMPNAIPLIKKSGLAIRRKSYNQAQSYLEEAKQFWPTHPDIPNLAREIKQKHEEIEQVIQKVEKASKNKKFYQARKHLQHSGIDTSSHSRLRFLEKTIHKRIEEANHLVRKAKTQLKEETKISLYLRALDICEDCDLALTGLKRYPPSPPKSISVGELQNGIELRWPKHNQGSQLSYEIIRKENAPPSRINDGINLGSTGNNHFIDLETEIGSSYYYAIFSIRGSVVSPTSCISKPILRKGNPTKLKVTPSDKSVDVHWVAPSKFHRIEVWRKKSGVGENEIKLKGVTKNGFSDNQLQNGQAYEYRIKTIFIDYNGEEVSSKDIFIQAEPLPPAKAISLTRKPTPHGEEFSLKQEGGREVRLYQASTHWPFYIEDLVSIEKLEEYSSMFTKIDTGKFRINHDFHGEKYVLPVVIQGDYALVGREEKITSLLDIQNIKYTMIEGKIMISWDWRKDIKEVQVCYGNANGNLTQEITVDRNYFDRKRGFEISNYPKEWDTMKIGVRSIMKVSKEQILSEGKWLVIRLRKVKVEYSITPRRNFLGGKSKSEFKFDLKSSGPLPTILVLAMQADNMPISLGNESVYEIFHILTRDPTQTESMNYIYSKVFHIPNLSKKTKYIYFRIFTPNKQHSNMLEIKSNSIKINI